MTEKKDYEVGYGKPPKTGRFKSGQSGNPKGRPPKAKRGAPDLGALLEQPVKVRSKGVEGHVSAYEAGLRKLAEQAIKGHVPSAVEFLGLCTKHGLMPPPPDPLAGRSNVVPMHWDYDEFIEWVHRYGLPPWEGERSGLPLSEEKKR